MRLSVVVPCYNEEENIPLFYKTIVQVFGSLMHHTELVLLTMEVQTKPMNNYIGYMRNHPIVLRLSVFPEILEKKRHYLQVFVMRQAILLQLSMQIFSSDRSMFFR